MRYGIVRSGADVGGGGAEDGGAKDVVPTSAGCALGAQAPSPPVLEALFKLWTSLWLRSLGGAMCHEHTLSHWLVYTT